MKSIVQEASSVAKAIEKGLEKVGNPRDFSIKVLEYPEKNFFGLTTKPAKIAVYCDDKQRKSHEFHPVVGERKDETEPRGRGRDRDRYEKRDYDETRSSRSERPERSERSESRQQNNRRRDGGSARPMAHKPAAAAHSETNEEAPVRRRTQEERPATPRPASEVPEVRRREPATPHWTPEIVQYVREWLNQVLGYMGRTVSFSIEQDGFHVRIVLDTALFDDAEHERRVLASLSLLILETCKHLFKVNLRDHRVVLTHKSQ